MLRDQASTLITTRVKALYKTHPFPHYPLLAKPLLQEGYMTHPGFSQAICRSSSPNDSIMVVGCGEILPYMIRKWSPKHTAITFVDLSEQSLQRARLRLLFTSGQNYWHCGAFEEYLTLIKPGQISHFDAFGVLHHMANPTSTLHAMATRLAPGGTIRLMVYNQNARAWIRHLNLAFKHLGLTFEEPRSIHLARMLLQKVGTYLPIIGERIQQIPKDSFHSDARFSDTFLHPREAQISPELWLKTIESSGLVIKGLFDRYGELDDLPNPLAIPPSLSQLTHRSKDHRFEGNFELFLCKPTRLNPMHYRKRIPHHLQFTSPPRLWFSFTETTKIPFLTRHLIWHYHLKHVLLGRGILPNQLLQKLPKAAINRLCRLGAILPTQVNEPRLKDMILAPLITEMTPPTRPKAISIRDTPIPSLLRDIFQTLNPDKIELAVDRIENAQFR